MFLADFLIALGIALLLTAIFAAAFGSTGPWSGFWVFFLVILLVSWAAGLWVRPFGPALFGVFWAPYLVFGLIAALLIAAATPPNRPDGDLEARRRARTDVTASGEPVPKRGVERTDRPETAAEDTAVEGASVALGVFFWILLLVLLTAVVLGYF